MNESFEHLTRDLELREQPPQATPETLARAIKNSDLNALEAELLKIDQQLTNDIPDTSFKHRYAKNEQGESYKQVVLWDHVKDELKKICDGKERTVSVEFYLSDGGMSRIALNKQDGKIHVSLTTNSTDEVKEKWEDMGGDSTLHE